MSLITYQYRYSERLLWICVAGSMLLHALVVWQMRSVESAAVPAQPLRATIRTEARPAPPPTALPEPRPAEPPKPAPPPAAPKALPKAAAPEKAAPQFPTPQANPVAPVQPTPPAATAAPTPATAPGESVSGAKLEAKGGPAPPAAPPSPSNAEDIALINGYQSQLAQVTDKYKRYPAEAIEQGWDGVVQVRLLIGSDGKIAGSDIEASSKHDLLDEQARVALLKAKPMVQIPPGLRGRSFSARVKIEFRLPKPD